jgi:hypothetical protein
MATPNVETAKGGGSINQRKVTTPEFRASFPHVFKAHAFNDKQEAKFSLTMLFPKTADLKALKKAAAFAAEEKWGPREKWPKGLRMPFRDGDEKSDLTGYTGTIYVNANSKQRPGCVDNRLTPIVEEDNTFYAGCYARATLIAFAYDTSGNRGVSFSLQNIQKLRDGEPFSGRRKAEDDFDAVGDTSDDESSYDDDSGDDAFGI